MVVAVIWLQIFILFSLARFIQVLMISREGEQNLCRKPSKSHYENLIAGCSSRI